ncbi:hypothetical protein ACH4GM_00455 [Streptomyces coeruleorubidus]|uniref:hypothetical protein n=1 Tax=Streptomyces coeruleorubidus TaxID=116188 RepID=UPI0037954283
MPGDAAPAQGTPLGTRPQVARGTAARHHRPGHRPDPAPDGNTGIGAALILTALAGFGGSSLTDFALALLIGLVVGTYSSVTAPPRGDPAPPPHAAPAAGRAYLTRPGIGRG